MCPRRIACIATCAQNHCSAAGRQGRRGRRAGVFWIMWRAGIVSAAPVQLMSDHVFLGASLASVLGAEAVLIRAHIARRAAAAAPRRHPAEHPLLIAGAPRVTHTSAVAVLLAALLVDW